jgi:hypothetical protein
MTEITLSALPAVFSLFCITLGVATPISASGQASEFPYSDRPLRKIFTAWETPEDGVIVITGGGRRIFELKPPPPKDTRNGWGHSVYVEPAVDPKGTTLLYVEVTVLFEQGVPLGMAKESAKLVEVDLRTRRQKTLMVVPGGAIGSPAYSAAGDRIALLVGRDFAVLDALTKSEVARLRNALMGPVNSSSNRASVLWNPFASDRIYIDSSRNCGLIDEQVVCGGPGEIVFEGSVARWPESHESSAAQMLQKVGLHPKPGGLWSPGGRYYFYHAGTEGFFCRDWIEGYDLEKRRAFHVRTLERHLYCD